MNPLISVFMHLLLMKQLIDGGLGSIEATQAATAGCQLTLPAAIQRK